uniref:hypothetical protein n=1 Tax=Turicimonas muris TaxID=1796652 RepID=UPI0025AF6484
MKAFLRGKLIALSASKKKLERAHTSSLTTHLKALEQKEVKISLFADDMIVYISDPKNSTRELLNLINNFGEVAGYKINSKESMTFLYTKYKQAEKE